MSNSKNPLSLIKYASSLGYYTLLDAAALAPTSTFSLRDHPVDAMAVSFYKMFGFPTGVGALIVKESFLDQLSRPWFAGGTVDVVQAPGMLHTMVAEPHERFEVSVSNFQKISTVNSRYKNLTIACTCRMALSTILTSPLSRRDFDSFQPTFPSSHCDSPHSHTTSLLHYRNFDTRALARLSLVSFLEYLQIELRLSVTNQIVARQFLSYF